jgi:hypothetical protein
VDDVSSGNEDLFDNGEKGRCLALLMQLGDLADLPFHWDLTVQVAIAVLADFRFPCLLPNWESKYHLFLISRRLSPASKNS